MALPVLRTARCQHAYRPIQLELLGKTNISSHRTILRSGATQCRSFSVVTVTKRSSLPLLIRLDTSRRHASSSAATAVKRSSPSELTAHSTKTPPPHRTPAVNPPPSARPPPLDLPTRAPDDPIYKYYFSLGRAYLTFYKTALKAIYTNYRTSRTLRSRLPSGVSPAAAAQAGLLTRADYQLLSRSSADIRKLPLFGLVLAVCGEFTPLVVLALSGFVPRTAWIPRQVQAAEKKRVARLEAGFQAGTLPDIEAPLSEKLQAIKTVADLSPKQILHLSRIWALHSSLWETLWEAPPMWLARRRVERWAAYLDADDATLRRDGGVKLLEAPEVVIACEQRGVDVLGRTEDGMRKALRGWMVARPAENPTSPLALGLVRPHMWGWLAEKDSPGLGVGEKEKGS